MKFITSVTQYRTISEPHFDRTLDLGNTKYGPDIIEWRKHIPDGVLRKILRKLPVHDEKEEGETNIIMRYQFTSEMFMRIAKNTTRYVCNFNFFN